MNVSLPETQLQERLIAYRNIVASVEQSNEERLEIMKDISRTYQELELFHVEENKQMMCQVLLIWCHHSLAYRQGMNEIMGVIYYTYRQQYEHQESTECELFWVLKRIMDDGNHKYMFNYNANISIDNTPIIKHIKQVTMPNLNKIDQVVFQIFEDNKISSEIFLMRWLKVSLEFEIQQIQEVWDYILHQFRHRKLKFIDSFTIAMLIELKPELLKIEYINNFEVLLLFQNYPKKSDYKKLLHKAVDIQKQLDRKAQWVDQELVRKLNPNYSIAFIVIWIARYLVRKFSKK